LALSDLDRQLPLFRPDNEPARPVAHLACGKYREALASPLSQAKLRLSGQLVWPKRYFDDRSGIEELAE
jgi:hypothetical protein